MSLADVGPYIMESVCCPSEFGADSLCVKCCYAIMCCYCCGLCGDLQQEKIESTRVTLARRALRSVPRNSMDSMAALEIER